MPEPPSAPDSPRTAPAAGPSGGDVPADVTPHLLVMPTVDGAPPGMVWPGQEGQPAWAIPVTVPAGTRGYALFVPLVSPGEGQPVPAQPAAPRVMVPAPGVPAQATPPAVEGAGGIPAPAGTGTTPTSTGTAPASNPTASAEAVPAAPTSTDVSSADTPPAGPTPAESATGATATGEAATGRSAAGGTAADESATAGPSTEGTPGPTPSPSSITPPTAPQAFAPPTAPQASAAPATPPAAYPPPGYPPPYAVTQPVLHPGGGWAPRPPVPRTSFLGARWPGPKPATGRAVPLAVLAGALGTAFFVPLNRVGIGWFLGWLTLTVGVLLAVRRRTADLPRTERLIRGGWAAAALVLLAVLAFRNAWWLVTFCVLGALGCATLAIVGGRMIRSILFGLLAAPFAAFRGLPWVRRHITASPDAGLVRKVAGSVVATVLVLLVFGSLLASADAAFSELIGATVPETDVGAMFRGIFLAAVGGLIAVAAVYTLTAPPDLSTVDKPSSRRLGLLEWAPAIAALTLLFAGFVVVQFTVLFGGQRHVQKVAGLSYSEYARSGFWQLLFVTLLTLAVLGGVSRWASRERPVERTALRVLLGLLSALSVVIVVSALSRMWTYQKVYSFTGERIFVMAFELLLGAVFLMILAAGVRWEGRWIPGTTVALAVAMLLGLAVLNPEDYAARRNILRYEQTGKIDAWYLRALSADATPALAKLPDPVRRCTLSWVADDLADADPWYAWNLGRYRARQELDRLGPNAIGGQQDCRKADQFDLPKTRGTR
ncbi:DUF4173 domain-containing protein [Micromonospora sp. DR5-3]|uniref:DUF4153 domain-containing protein n=1 Tax=unclassified Micromonospora TaxID=2617518 RepID=UPI0011D5EDCA|nr:MULTISPECIES: DUF4173 domain-containing protein [unclassified Micromonospora]MCW3814737.1 DUF4173 domain-containing protein [Micromonospora sp. DR5-3]TYC23523.1 DUF4173 domain-containing protein [Micromonospora sp. MP36]